MEGKKEGKRKEIRKDRMCWQRCGETRTLIGLYNGATTLESILAVPQKVRCRVII